ncbi:MAG: DUF6095 family protein [Flavobacteriaceae bacterium]
MNKPLLIKGLKKVFIGVLCCFIAPVIVMQAFKNQGHPFFLPVLIVGLLGMIAAFFYGFKGIRTLVVALLGKAKKTKA